MTQAAFQELDRALVFESKHNPRRRFDEAALMELADSITKVGILTPLLVRPRANGKGGVEIAAGHRRFRAAKLANLETLPCLVREMDDQTFMEILTVENLQREDVHALDEAKGYEALMAAPYKMDVQRIAEKVGRSVKYIYDRVKLLALTKEAQDLFWNGTILAGHAIILARLTPAEQLRCLEDRREGLLRPELGLFDPLREGEDDEESLKPCSVRELQAWVDRRVRFVPATADAMLFPETVMKVETTEKKIIPITYEYLVHEDVRNAERVYSERSWKRADGQHDSKLCERAVLGVVASGPHRGEAFDVCIDKKTCLVHWKDDVKAAEQKAKGTPNSPKAKAAEEKAAKARKAEEERRERAEERKKHWVKMAPKIEAVVMERVNGLPVTGVLGDLLIKALQGYRPIKTSVGRGTTAEDLLRHLGSIVLTNEIREWDAAEEFPALAKRLGVDLSPFVKLETKGKKGQAA